MISYHVFTFKLILSKYLKENTVLTKRLMIVSIDKTIKYGIAMISYQVFTFKLVLGKGELP